MSEQVIPCPEHGVEATMLGILGDSYCMVPGCQWWDMPAGETDEEV